MLTDTLRKMIDGFIKKHQYATAVYWADKLVSLSHGVPKDIYLYANCLYLTRQYHRAINALKKYKLLRNVAGRYLAALCHYECQEFEESLEKLECGEMGLQNPFSSLNANKSLFSNDHTITHDDEEEEDESGLPVKGMASSVCLLRGKVYEAMENYDLAMESYFSALRLDITCYEVFDKLTQFHMLSKEDEEICLSCINNIADPEERELVMFLYKNKIKTYNPPGDVDLPTHLEAFHENLDVIVSVAERHFNICELKECYALTTRILKVDPYNAACLPLHIAVLKMLNKPNELFYLGHRLVDLYPKKPESWFAVGCFYLCIGKGESSRRFFMKAAKLDRHFGPAWLALGHAFAFDKEHDQAMASYSTAIQVMKGCHVPLLYVGLEYGSTNNLKFAENFFNEALAMCPDDPYVLHELGTLHFQYGKYVEAKVHLMKAVDRLRVLFRDSPPSSSWEPLINNLAHVCRKLKQYDEAMEYHSWALSLQPHNASTLTAMGFVCALQSRPIEAVDYFHQALGLRPEDTFAQHMLTQIIDSSNENGVPGITDQPTESVLDHLSHPLCSTQSFADPLSLQKTHSRELSMDAVVEDLAEAGSSALTLGEDEEMDISMTDT